MRFNKCSTKRFISLFMMLLIAVCTHAINTFTVTTTVSEKTGATGNSGSLADAVAKMNTEKGSWNVVFDCEGVIDITERFLMYGQDEINLVGNGKVTLNCAYNKGFVFNDGVISVDKVNFTGAAPHNHYVIFRAPVKSITNCKFTTISVDIWETCDLIEGCEFYSGSLTGNSIESKIEKVSNCSFFATEASTDAHIELGIYGTITGCTFEGVDHAFYLVFADVIENCNINAVIGVHDCAVGLVSNCNFNCSKYWMRYYEQTNTPGYNIGKINKCTFAGCGALEYHNSEYCSIKEISECEFVADRIQLYLDTKDMLIKDNTFTFNKSALCITNDGNGVYTNNLFFPQVFGLDQTIWRNDEAPAPVIKSVTRQNGKFVIEGTASAEATIEIFLSDGSQASAVQLVKSLKTSDDYSFKAEVAIEDLKYNYSCFLATATYGGSTSCLSKPVCCAPELIIVDANVIDYSCSNPHSEVNITVKDWTANCVATLNGKSIVPTTEKDGIAMFVFNDLEGGSYVFEATNEKYKLQTSFEFDLTIISYKSVIFKEDNTCHKSIDVSSSNSKEPVTKEDGRLVLFKRYGSDVVAKSEKYYDLPEDEIFDLTSLANGEYRLKFTPSGKGCIEESFIDFKVDNPMPVSMSLVVDSHCDVADGGQDFSIKSWNSTLNGRLYKIDGTPSSTNKDVEYVASDNESLIAEKVVPTTEEQDDNTITAYYNIRGLGKGTYRFVVSNNCQTWMNRVFNVDVKYEDLKLAIFSIDDCNNFVSVKGTELSDGDYYLIKMENGEEDPTATKLLSWKDSEKVVDIKSLESGDYKVKFVPSADNVCSMVSQYDFTASTPEMSSQVTTSPSKCEESNGSITFSVKNWLSGYHGALYSVDQDFASGSVKGKETLLYNIEPVDRNYNSADGSFTANFKQNNLEAGLYRFAITDDCGEVVLNEFFDIEGNDEKSPVIEESVSKVGDNAFMISILVSDYNPNTKFSYLIQDECNRVENKLNIDEILDEITSAPSASVVGNSGLSLSCLNNPVAKGEAAEVIVSMPEEVDFTYSVYDAKGAVVVPATANKAAASLSENGVSYPVIVKNVNQVLIVRVQTKTESKSILVIPE